MNRIQALTAIFISALLLPFAAGLTMVKADSTVFPIGSALHIESPINRTYTSGSLVLDVSFGSLLGANIDHSLTYSLDGTSMGNLTIVPHYPDHFSFQGYFTASMTLPELSKGPHELTVYAEHYIFNFTTNDRVFHSRITEMDNATVIFNISDTIPVNELTPPVISNLSVENITYPSAKLSLNFSVDKAVMWTGYCLDDKNVTITDWWNTQASARSFNATLKGLSDGSHSLVVYAEDIFGNIAASNQTNFTIDTTPPKVSLLSIENKTYDSANIPLSFAINESVSQVTYSLDGKNNITIAGNSTLNGLPNGGHNVTLYAWDKVGNIGASETACFSVKVHELFPATFATASAASAVVVGVGLVAYFRKRRQ